jgi:hypothetical protein
VRIALVEICNSLGHELLSSEPSASSTCSRLPGTRTALNSTQRATAQRQQIRLPPPPCLCFCAPSSNSVLKEFLNEMLARLSRTLANVSSAEGLDPTTQKQGHALLSYYLSLLREGLYKLYHAGRRFYFLQEDTRENTGSIHRPQCSGSTHTHNMVQHLSMQNSSL